MTVQRSELRARCSDCVMTVQWSMPARTPLSVASEAWTMVGMMIEGERGRGRTTARTMEVVDEKGVMVGERRRREGSAKLGVGGADGVEEGKQGK